MLCAKAVLLLMLMLLLLLRYPGGVAALGHLQDVVDDVLLVHRAGQRDRPLLSKQGRGVLQVIQDVVQLRGLNNRATRRTGTERGRG